MTSCNTPPLGEMIGHTASMSSSKPMLYHQCGCPVNYSIFLSTSCAWQQHALLTSVIVEWEKLKWLDRANAIQNVVKENKKDSPTLVTTSLLSGPPVNAANRIRYPQQWKDPTLIQESIKMGPFASSAKFLKKSSTSNRFVPETGAIEFFVLNLPTSRRFSSILHKIMGECHRQILNHVFKLYHNFTKLLTVKHKFNNTPICPTLKVRTQHPHNKILSILSCCTDFHQITVKALFMKFNMMHLCPIPSFSFACT